MCRVVWTHGTGCRVVWTHGTRQGRRVRPCTLQCKSSDKVKTLNRWPVYVWRNDASLTAQQVTHTDNLYTSDMFRSLAVYLTTLSAHCTYGRIVGWFVNWNGRERWRPLPNLETCCPAICLEDWETTKELGFRIGTSLIEVEGLFPAAVVNDIFQSHSAAYFLALCDRFITTYWYAVPSVPFMVYVHNPKFVGLFRTFP
jgi:hypothetical protein